MHEDAKQRRQRGCAKLKAYREVQVFLGFVDHVYP